jgi:hypothetical protein
MHLVKSRFLSRSDKNSVRGMHFYYLIVHQVSCVDLAIYIFTLFEVQRLFRKIFKTKTFLDSIYQKYIKQEFLDHPCIQINKFKLIDNVFFLLRYISSFGSASSDRYFLLDKQYFSSKCLYFYQLYKRMKR